MDNIKFRMFTNGKMFYDVQVFDCLKQQFIYDVSNNNTLGFNHKADSIFMQFTGKLDKNNKDVYGQDIARITTLDGEVFIGEIMYDTERSAWRVEGMDGEYEDCTAYLGECKEVEVLGNVCENPKLTGETK
jgi:hypothetical protein